MGAHGSGCHLHGHTVYVAGRHVHRVEAGRGRPAAETGGGGRGLWWCVTLASISTASAIHHPRHLLTIPAVPVNLKDRDAFHITIEEYLLALIAVIDDLSRLAVNSVTLGDNALAVQISGFIKDLHAGFQVLNLKNDILRKRVDSIKYAVKKVEDVVYDLSLRNLIPAQESQ